MSRVLEDWIKSRVISMDDRIISISILAIIGIAFVGGFVYLNVFHDNGEDGTKTYDSEGLNEVAKAFADKYDGGFEEKDFTIENTDEYAWAYYTASGMGGDTSYYVKYTVMEDADAAAELFNTTKAQYQAKVGPSAMSGLTYYGTEEKAGFDDGYGYYGVCSMTMGQKTVTFVTLHYAAVYSNVYIEASLYDSDGTLDTAPIAPAIEAMFAGFE